MLQPMMTNKAYTIIETLPRMTRLMEKSARAVSSCLMRDSKINARMIKTTPPPNTTQSLGIAKAYQMRMARFTPKNKYLLRLTTDKYAKNTTPKAAARPG